jgi:putative intracellular protease/amidase
MLVICAKRYNGHELWTLLGVLQQKGVAFEVVSSQTTIRDELTMQPNTIDRTVYDVQFSETQNFAGVSVVSGNMADTEAYWTDPHIKALLMDFRNQHKIVSAICCSVPTLGPVVQGIKVSFFPLVRSRHRLENAGAILSTVSLSVDKLTVTAENQMITEMWAEEIANLIEGKPPLYSFTDSGFTPKGSERKMPKAVRASIDAARAKGPTV